MDASKMRPLANNLVCSARHVQHFGLKGHGCAYCRKLRRSLRASQHTIQDEKKGEAQAALCQNQHTCTPNQGESQGFQRC
ncbi:MAG: hypothetical protein ACI9DC_000398 [Gammaproteobacteria bacterium]|jgi:hypothetical protein